MDQKTERSVEECNAILREAETKAEENSQSAEEKEEQYLAMLAEEAENESRKMRHTLRKNLNKQAAG